MNEDDLDRDSPWYLGRRLEEDTIKKMDYMEFDRRAREQSDRDARRAERERFLQIMDQEDRQRRIDEARLEPPPTKNDEIKKLKEEVMSLKVLLSQTQNLRENDKKRLLNTIIGAIHEIEGDDSFDTDNPDIALGYLIGMKAN